MVNHPNRSQKKLAAHAMKLFLKAADERCNSLQEVWRVSNWTVGGPGTKKQRAYDRLSAADAAYEAARAELLSAIERAEG
jgi:hypothetical protein